jgi:hypothetical protein
MGICCSHGRDCEDLSFLECGALQLRHFVEERKLPAEYNEERETMPVILFANSPSLSFLS